MCNGNAYNRRWAAASRAHVGIVYARATSVRAHSANESARTSVRVHAALSNSEPLSPNPPLSLIPDIYNVIMCVCVCVYNISSSTTTTPGA